MLNRNIKKNVSQNSTSRKSKKISPAKSVKYIVPMPGRSSWLLKASTPEGLGLASNSEKNDYSSESSFDHSHHIMDRKFIID